jgi:hypothetical protein
MAATTPVQFQADTNGFTRALASGHLRRTGHELAGFYEKDPDSEFVLLVRTCGCKAGR